ADALVTDRLALRMEFRRGLHLWRPGVGTRRAASRRGRNTDRLTTMDGWRLRTGIFDLGHRHGGNYFGGFHLGRPSTLAICSIYAQPTAGLTTRCSQPLAEKKITDMKLESKKLKRKFAAASGG